MSPQLLIYIHLSQEEWHLVSVKLIGVLPINIDGSHLSDVLESYSRKIISKKMNLLLEAKSA